MKSQTIEIETPRPFASAFNHARYQPLVRGRRSVRCGGTLSVIGGHQIRRRAGHRFDLIDGTDLRDPPAIALLPAG